jgi:MobA/MobL family
VAIFHCQVTIVSRGSGQSACASAAYCAGENITCERTQATHDYSRKKGVDHSEIISPVIGKKIFNANRSLLWNLVEAAEKRKDAQLIRSVVVALPTELDNPTKIQLVREFIKENFVDRGMIADLNIHDINSHNPHAHILLTMRDLVATPTGEIEFGQKNRTWNERSFLEQYRANWAKTTNKYLELAQVPDRIDHRSLADQGIERIPQIHIGVAASAMERKGMQTERGDLHRQITAANQQLADAQAESERIDRAIKDQTQSRPQVQPSCSNFEEIRIELERLANRAKARGSDRQQQPQQRQQPPSPIPDPQIAKRPTYQQEYQRISAKLKRLIIESCEADPFNAHVPDFDESQLKFIDRFSKYMTEKRGYTNPEQIENTLTISDYQREYDRRIFEYIAKYPSEVMRKEGLTDLHFNIEEAMKVDGYEQQNPIVKNELSKGNGMPITIDPDYQEEDDYENEEEETRQSFQDMLNKSVVHKSKSSQSNKRSQGRGMSM